MIITFVSSILVKFYKSTFLKLYIFSFMQTNRLIILDFEFKEVSIRY